MWHWENNRVVKENKGKQAEQKKNTNPIVAQLQKAESKRQQAKGSAHKVEGRRQKREQKESRISILICQACRARCNTQKDC